MKRFVIFGGTGRIGQMVQQYVTDPSLDDMHIVIQTRSPTAPPNTKHMSYVTWDAKDWDTFETLIEPGDCILNLIGQTPTGNHHPTDASYQDINVDLATRMAQVAARQGAGRFLAASSASVYGRPEPNQKSFSEHSDLHPAHPYANSKVAMERALAQVQSDFPDCEICTLRITTIAGADALLQNAMKSTNDNPLVLDQFANGQGPIRSYIGPDLLSNILLQLARTSNHLPGVLNVATANEIAMEDLLLAGQALGYDIHWTFQPAPANAIQKVILDTTLLEKILDTPAVQTTPSVLAKQGMDFLKSNS